MRNMKAAEETQQKLTAVGYPEIALLPQLGYMIDSHGGQSQPCPEAGAWPGLGLSPLPCSHLLELCLARYLSLHFFFFPKGLQLGDSLWLGWGTLATRLPRQQHTPMAQLPPQTLGQQQDCPSAMQEKQAGCWDRQRLTLQHMKGTFSCLSQQ